MAKKPLRCLCVGKLKSPFWKEAAAHYLMRLGQWRSLEMTETKDGAAALPPAQRKAEEARRLLGALQSRDVPLALDERGLRLTSPRLAALLRDLDEGRGRPCFVVGGPWGLDAAVLDSAHAVLRLSDMTLPHELARVLLLEQLYRAECILRNAPYHH